MTREDIIHLAKECSSAVYELCMNNPSFNTTDCPIGANGLSDVVLNVVLNAFQETKELASIQQPQGLDKAAFNYSCVSPFRNVEEAAFKAGAEWMAGQGVNADFGVCKLANRAWLTAIDEKKFTQDIFDNFGAGDKVVVQIRKK